MYRAVGRAILLTWLAVCPWPQASTAAGQTVGAATGAINVTVTDPTGAVLPGVTIVISSDALMGNNGTSTASTNEEGLYRFLAVPPGDYTLMFARDGFRTVSREGIHISLGFTATVNVELEIASLNESVMVERKSAVVDMQSTAMSANFDAGLLANLPGARTMGAILAATPTVAVSQFDVGGNLGGPGPYGAYGTFGFNRPMIEGIVLTGIFPTGFIPNYGAFDEVSVGTAASGVESWAHGVQMQIVSKSGGNQYRGTLYVDYENKAWQSFNIDEHQISRGARGGGGLSPRDANRLWRYHDLNADVGGYIRPDRLWWYASLREQGTSARRVNFQVEEPQRTRVTNYTGKGTYQITRNNKIVGFGDFGRNHQPNLLGGFTLGAAAAINRSEESTAELLARGWIWKGEWNSVINNRVFFEARAGQFGANRGETPNVSTSSRFEDAITLNVRGGNRDWQQNFRRSQLLGSLSYFEDGWLGTHHLKIGGEALRATWTEIWREGSYFDNVVHVQQNSLPSEVYLFETPSMSEAGVWSYAAYAADSWRLTNRLTLSLGVRFDRVQVFLPEQAHLAGRFNPTPQMFRAVENVIDWNLVTPRIGASHDLTRDGRTIAKFSYGEYAPGFASPPTDVNPNSPVWLRRFAWSDPDGSGAWEPGEEGRETERRGGVAIETLDPGLLPLVAREAGAWIERELFTNVGLRTGVVWRGERQHSMRQNVNWPFAAFSIPVTILDPGPDGMVGTVDDGQGIHGYDLARELVALQTNVVRNVPNSNSHYWTWDITANRRFSGRWSLMAGFAHTWNRDQASAYFGQSVRQNPYPLTPNDLINAGRDGSYEFRTWSATIHGTYEGPWAVMVMPFLRHQSGQPFGRTFSTRLNYGNSIRILAEPIDTRRMDNVTLLDVRVEKGFRLARRGRVAGFVDVFNLLNANPEQNINWTSGPAFLRPLNIVAPRIARIGAKLEW